MPTHHASHKLTRQDLKHDSFTEWTAKATEFLQEHYVPVAIGLLAVVAVIVGAQFYQRGQVRAQERAAYLLYQGESLLLQGAYGSARHPLEEIRQSFADTPLAAQAALDLAQVQTALGEHDAALATIEQQLSKEKGATPLRHALSLLKVSTLGSLGRNDEALAAGRAMLAAGDLTPQQRFDTTLLLADLLRAGGRLGEAVELLTSLQRDILNGSLQVPARDLDSRLQVLRALAG